MAEDYVGVKFRTLFEGIKTGHEKQRKEIVKELVKLNEKGLLDKNNGNVSVRVKEGLIITPTGTDMSSISSEDPVLVTGINQEAKLVYTHGRNQPSSESIMHWLIYQEFPKINAVVHFHDSELLKHHKKFTETEKQYPYGTIELAHEVLKTLKKKQFIIIKNHGAIAIGKSLTACHRLISRAKNKI
jgi:L-fuculose-phosphate aldolase